MPFFLFNNLPSTYLFRSGYVEAKPKVWTQINELDVRNGIFADAERLNQVVVLEADSMPVNVPGGSSSDHEETKPAVVITSPPVASGMTQEEYQAFLAAKNAPVHAPAAEPAVLAPAPDETSTEATAVSETTEEAPADAAAAPAKRGRKAAAPAPAADAATGEQAPAAE